MSNVKQSSNATTQPLINDENFQLLKDVQRRISEATGISPSVRIIVNHLVNDEQLKQIEAQLIQQFKGLANV